MVVSAGRPRQGAVDAGIGRRRHRVGRGRADVVINEIDHRPEQQCDCEPAPDPATPSKNHPQDNTGSGRISQTMSRFRLRYTFRAEASDRHLSASLS